METETSYLTRRARQERASAADAGSAEARTAHLELALRMVKAAVEPALWRAWSARRTSTDSTTKVHSALVAAFPLPSSHAFEDLLERLD